MRSRGRVVFVGAGPGDPRLLTLRGRDAIAACEILLHDAGIDPEILAHAPSAATREPVLRVHGADAATHAERTGAMLANHALAGASVVRLVHDDPLAETGEEEVRAVAKSGVPFEIVPGVHSATALAAFAGFPLTRGRDISPSFAVIVATSQIELHDWHKLTEATDTLVVLTSPAVVREVIDTLVYHGQRDTRPAALFANLGTPSQRALTSPLIELRDRVTDLVRDLAPDATLHLVVGDVVAHRDALAWFDRRPLFGKRVLVTRAADQASSTARLLGERGARVVLLPTIEVHAPSDPAPMERAIAALGTASASWDLVAFTSANGVERAWSELHRQKRDARAFGGLLVAAIGPATAAALEARGVHPDIVAAELKGEGLAAAILAQRPKSSPAPRVLLLRALVARDALPEALREAGCTVDIVPVYETKPASAAAGAALAEQLESGSIDAVTLTSSSTATHLVALLGGRAPVLLGKTRVASIGPITTETATQLGIRVDVTADPHTVPALIESLERSFEARS
ncbi:MAG: Uroporphyrinogen-III methyltransferase [Myxococcaceae bacterium]|nr:Uroporphyrinogen-III methyltransferase [Myxococcaceae bacterium]